MFISLNEVPPFCDLLANQWWIFSCEFCPLCLTILFGVFHLPLCLECLLVQPGLVHALSHPQYHSLCQAGQVLPQDEGDWCLWVSYPSSLGLESLQLTCRPLTVCQSLFSPGIPFLWPLSHVPPWWSHTEKDAGFKLFGSRPQGIQHGCPFCQDTITVTLCIWIKWV